MNKIIRNLASILPSELVFGESYRYAKDLNKRFLDVVDKTDFVQSYQQEKLKKLTALANKSVFYSRIGINSLSFKEIPFIDRNTILGNSREMIISREGADYVTTGGTSGKPLGFYINKNRKGFEWFWMTNNWSKAGFKTTDYRAVLRNHKLNGRKFQIDKLLREYQFDNFSLNDAYLEYIIDTINSNGIKFLHAYPSASFTFASHLLKSGRHTSLQAFFCGSENIFPYQKDLIEKKLNLRMYTWYGHSEKLILAGEGTDCQNYHSIPFYGVTELIDEAGSGIVERGKTGEIVGTGFINTRMPFIRYRTGDFADYEGEVCPNCGHIGTTFSNVRGRWQGDRIYKADNSVVTTTALNLHSDIYKYIKNLQYYQEIKGKLTIRVVPDDSYTTEIRDKMIKELMQKVTTGLDIEIDEVDKIELSGNNKYSLLIQKIK